MEPEKKVLLFQDPRLVHKNTGYNYSETYGFIKGTNITDKSAFESFKYNEEASENNFQIYIATEISNSWLEGKRTPTQLFDDFNKSQTGKLTMYY